MTVKATRADAMRLMMEGSKALAQVEANGIRVDEVYLKKAEKQVIERIAELENELKKDEVYKKWREVYGDKMKLGASKQLGTIFYDHMDGKFEPIGFTPSEQYRTDKLAMERIDHPFAKKYIEWKEMEKALRTDIQGLMKEVVDGYIHPFFHQHTTTSGRTSATAINCQNLPTRNVMIAEIIRKAFIPRDKNNVFIETDLNMHEVRVSCFYHKDPELIKYCKDSTADMHRDQAMNLFLLPEEEISKEIRFYCKNQFVFSQFYGDFYKQEAPLIYQTIDRYKLKTVSGKDLREHLKENGIKRLGDCDFEKDAKRGTFEYVVMQAQNKLWDQFKVYAKWKKSWWEEYCRKGYVDFLTGFRAQGVMKKNEVLNIPIQGVASQCLVWILIQLSKWLRKNKMKSKIINEVHDSLLSDCPREEVSDYIGKVKELAEESIQKEWSWMIVPLKIEVEICLHNWFEKTKFDFDKWCY